MKKNVGTADRSIRLLLAIVIAILYFTDVISGTLAIILGIIGVALVITSLFSFCPAYAVVKLSTAKKETN
jgi:amino acid transporter